VTTEKSKKPNGSQALERKITEAQEILTAIGVPLGKGELGTERRKRRLALALLAAANIKPNTAWTDASIYKDPGSHALLTREMIVFWNEYYGERVSSGSYDDVRRKDLIWLVEAGVVLRSANKPNASTNDPTRRYAVTPGASDVVRLYGTKGWASAVEKFRLSVGDLRAKLERKRNTARLPVTLPDGKTIGLSPGPHNELQKAIIEEFLPRYGFGAEVLYIGDTAKKLLHVEEARLRQIGFFELSHDTLPDIVAFSRSKNWLYLIEAVHSANPINQLRHLNLERLTARCTVPRVYVSAFMNRDGFRKFVADISWETEVWLADAPDHLIHFNGEKFLGPYTAS